MTLEQQSDQQLGQLVAAEAPSEEAKTAFFVLYDRHARMTERFIAARIDRRHVADIHQQAWTRAWEKSATFRQESNYRGWLLTIARNLVIDQHRSDGRRQTTQIEGAAATMTDDNLATPEEQQLYAEELHALAQCLEELEENVRTVVRGRLAGRPYSELSAVVGIQQAAAHKMYFVGKNQLRDCVAVKLK